MFRFIKKILRHSKVNFYYQNLIWNISFWIGCRKIYKIIYYKKKTDNFQVDTVGKMHYTYETIKKKRFSGYMYKNNIYLDNPGIQIKDRELWNSWRKKNLIK